MIHLSNYWRNGLLAAGALSLAACVSAPPRQPAPIIDHSLGQQYPPVAWSNTHRSSQKANTNRKPPAFNQPANPTDRYAVANRGNRQSWPVANQPQVNRPTVVDINPSHNQPDTQQNGPTNHRNSQQIATDRSAMPSNPIRIEPNPTRIGGQANNQSVNNNQIRIQPMGSRDQFSAPQSQGQNAPSFSQPVPQPVPQPVGTIPDSGGFQNQVNSQPIPTTPRPAPVVAAVPQPKPKPAPVSEPKPKPEPKPAVPKPTFVKQGNQAVVALLDEASGFVGNQQWAKAGAALERALRLEPRNASIWHDLAQIRLQQRSYKQASSLAAKSNTLAGSDRSLKRRNWQLIAVSRLAQGNEEGADAAKAQAALLK